MVEATKAPSAMLGWVYERRNLFPILTDASAWLLAIAIVPLLQPARVRFSIGQTTILMAVALAAHLAVGYGIGVYRFRWRVSSFEEVSALGITWLASALAVMATSLVMDSPLVQLPAAAVVVGAVAALLAMFTSRVIWRRFWELQRRPDRSNCKQTIVLGAGDGGVQVIKAMLADPDSTYYPAAVLDDDSALQGRRIAGVVVSGTRHDLERVARFHGAEVLLVAIPSASATLIQEAAELAKELNLELRVLPAMSELVKKMTVADVRPPTVDDLLGRDPVNIDLEAVAGYIRGKRVLITGAGGSIGSELSRQVSRFGPSELYLLDRDESALHGLQLTMEGRALLDTDRLVVADIRDRARVFELFQQHRPEVVFHTAALKHLTLLEQHPEEGIKTNVLGTKNLLDAAQQFGVGRFVNISTDKAADPTSVLGATKLAAEHLTARMAKEVGQPYLSVRFGNVLGSRGSVLPTFMAQLEDGHPLTVTDPEATRYFMTIPEAVRLVVQAGAIGDPGEVLILDMGEPVKILDLANQLISLLAPSATVEFTGLRPGEKLHEVLIATDEVGTARVHPRIIHTPGDTADPAEALVTMGPQIVTATREQLMTEHSLALS